MKTQLQDLSTNLKKQTKLRKKYEQQVSDTQKHAQKLKNKIRDWEAKGEIIREAHSIKNNNQELEKTLKKKEKEKSKLEKKVIHI